MHERLFILIISLSYFILFHQYTFYKPCHYHQFFLCIFYISIIYRFDTKASYFYYCHILYLFFAVGHLLRTCYRVCEGLRLAHSLMPGIACIGFLRRWIPILNFFLLHSKLKHHLIASQSFVLHLRLSCCSPLVLYDLESP